MPKKIWIAVVFLILLVAGIFVVSLSGQMKFPLLVSRTDPPKIQFEEETHILGSVQEGIEIPYTFKIHNVGGEPLIIKNASTTCGCTLITIKDRQIAPGKTGDLDVVMDTAMKQGRVQKAIDVFSNDPKFPKKTVFLEANVLIGQKPPLTGLQQSMQGGSSLGGEMPDVMTMSNPHQGLTEVGKAKIFTENCAVCHVQRGKGKTGGALFAADCAMCHGQHGEGAEGPALIPRDYQNKAVLAHVKEVISYGSKQHRSMPGFLKTTGGPLTETDIDSILTFLKTQSLSSAKTAHAH